MIKKVKKYIRVLKEYDHLIADLEKQYNRPKWWFYLDATLCRFLVGTNTVYYFSHTLYRLNWMERNQFINDSRTKKVKELFNSYSENKDGISNKVIFNNSISQYIKREWLYSPDHTEEEIRDFLNRNESIIVKPIDAFGGEGVRKVNSGEALSDIGNFVSDVKEHHLMLESYIRQHPRMMEVNPSSVNTVRVTTVRDKAGEVHVIAASLRAGGKDQVVDNLHADGVQYPIDIETGLIISGGTRFDGTRNVYFHPSTNTQMIGFRIPNWDSVICTVKEAAKIPVGVRYLGWDIAITEDGCDVVEANISQGCNGMQLDGVGKYNMIMQYR